ncbi:MAG: class I mannose-6-phosphate isomerase [Bacteroidales bacterium]|nr:class I mannose-6-phosphate isomerase [Bacteroidales bacterium]
MSELYPLKFEPLLKDKVWGGFALEKHFNKKPDGLPNIGESWELSSVDGNLSIVSNGFLAGNNIEELIEVYMGDITGDSIFEKFGNTFPLLIKFIEAEEDLSIQVHPGDVMAKGKHNDYGKTEMWYVLESRQDAKIYTGFKEGVTKEIYEQSILDGTLPDLLFVESARPGDTFFTPAGRIHAIGKGIVLVEIQQTSDLTYRISDWNRKSIGNVKRELHLDLALEAMDFDAVGKNKIKIEPVLNKTENLVSCEFFHTNILSFNSAIKKEYYLLDSFVVYICTEGEFQIRWEGNSEKVSSGETVLLPAMIKEVILEPTGTARLLEVYIISENIS